MRVTEQFYRENEAKRKRTVPCPVVQKLQNDTVESAPDNDQTGNPEMDGGCDRQFRVAITLCISDERDRDNDGAASTLLDCLIAAVGRLAQMDSRTLRKHAARLKRK